MHSLESFNEGLFHYLDASPTPFHAVSEAQKQLVAAGFEELKEANVWSLTVGKNYYIKRNDSSLIAFRYANNSWAEKSARFFGSHCDSPCLRVKPNAEIVEHNYLKLGVEVYGGVLLNPWFDRDLSLAGRVFVETENNESIGLLINFKRAIAIIPSLAIHLDREANQNRSINAQKDILPLLMQLDSEINNKTPKKFADILLDEVKQSYPTLAIKGLRDFELSFYDVQKAAYLGLNADFISSARLDNLLSCYVGLQALIQVQKNQNALLVINDHEEVGSQSAQGAQGTFLKSVLQRICAGEGHESEVLARCLSSSLFISADNAHGVHPNFSDKHDKNHGPILNAGPVIKINANQRYATSSLTSTYFKKISEQVSVPTQTFVIRTDMACGSTIGPITSAVLGVQTIDVGVPTFAMHSIRETAGRLDAFYLYQITKRFFDDEKVLS